MRASSAKRVAVIGGGIIGVAVARELTRVMPDSSVTLMEKEDRLAAHQTGHNSGVVHAGIYYEPGSLKAFLCRRGASLLAEYAQDRRIPFDRCGKVVVARDDAEIPALRGIHERAVANRVPGVRMISRGELLEIEPHVAGRAALHSPDTAIIDYVALTENFGKDLEAGGGLIRLDTKVSGVVPEGSEVHVSTLRGRESFDLVIACTGLQSDRLTRPHRDDPRIIPFYGDYFLVRPEKSHLANGLIYPVPDPRYPFLGVHVTKRVDGALMLGPNAFLSLGREAYGRFGVNLADVISTIGFGGFWRFAGNNLPAAARETKTALSRRAFVMQAQQFIPELRFADVRIGGRGVRAQAMDRTGALVDDFVIGRQGRLIQVRNAPSPGATASLAIAEHIVAQSVAAVSGTS